MMKQFLMLPAVGGMALAVVLASGCAKAQAARSTPDGPPLEMPASPPREVETTETEAPPPMPLPQEPARNAPPPRTRVTPPAQQPRPEAPKAEPPKAEPPPAPPPQAPPVEEPRPPSTLQTKPAGEEGDVERGIRAALVRATNDLNRVDYRTLNTDARVQYDSAKLFIRQAEDAVRKKNLEYAKAVADKAAALAAQLAGR